MDDRDPATRWFCYKYLPQNTKKRVNLCLRKIKINPVLEKAKDIFGREFVARDDGFSAGRDWICMKLVSEPENDEEKRMKIILRVRIPPAKGFVADQVFKNNENAGFFREQHTADTLRECLTTVRVPRIYHLSPWGSPLAKKVGSPFMLVECMAGNKLSDILRYKGIAKYSELDEETQDHIMAQWAAMVVQMTTLKSSHIGPIVPFRIDSGDKGTWRSKLANLYELDDYGTFSRTSHYFASNLCHRIAAINHTMPNSFGTSQQFVTRELLGALVFGDILVQQNFWKESREEPFEFPLVHKSLTEDNVLMDDEFNFVALVDLKDVGGLPEELQDSYVWDCWKSQESKEKYCSMLTKAEEDERSEGYEIRFPLSKVVDNKVKAAYELYARLGTNTFEDRQLVILLLELVEMWEGFDPIHYLVGCVVRHWSSCYGIPAAWALDPGVGQIAWEVVNRAMHPLNFQTDSDWPDNCQLGHLSKSNYETWT